MPKTPKTPSAPIIPDPSKEISHAPTRRGVKENIKDNIAFIIMGLFGIGALFALNATVGEHFATGVGPDFLIKLPAVFVRLALILWLRRIIMVFVFPTILVFSRKGDQKESEFTKRWNMSDGAYDPRIGLSIGTYLGSLFIATLIVLFAL